MLSSKMLKDGIMYHLGRQRQHSAGHYDAGKIKFQHKISYKETRTAELEIP